MQVIASIFLLFSIIYVIICYEWMVHTLKKEICKIAAGIFILDQFVKFIMMSVLSYQETFFLIPRFLYFTYVKNTGGAWSIFSGNPWLLTMIGLISIIGIGYYIYRKKDFTFLEVIYLGLVIGGILGNFVDRVFRSGVIDYIGFIFSNYYFPIFNIADICIVCGGILLMIDSLRSDQDGIRSNKR